MFLDRYDTNKLLYKERNPTNKLPNVKKKYNFFKFFQKEKIFEKTKELINLENSIFDTFYKIHCEEIDELKLVANNFANDSTLLNQSVKFSKILFFLIFQICSVWEDLKSVIKSIPSVKEPSSETYKKNENGQNQNLATQNSIYDGYNKKKGSIVLTETLDLDLDYNEAQKGKAKGNNNFQKKSF